MLYMDKFYSPVDADCGCADDCDCEPMTAEELEELFGDAEILEIESEEGEKLEFYVVDDFEYQENVYLVLMSRDEPYGYFIVREVIEGEESFLDTLEESEEAPVYEYYEKLLDEFDEEEFEEGSYGSDCCAGEE